MKRKIKFRAWDKSDSKMILLISRITIGLGGNLIDVREHDGNLNEIRYNPLEIELMQYTGLKDSKETEIFEGDIIAVENEGDVITVCKWDKGGFTLEDNAGGHWTRQLFHQPDRIEVIGNIYENPEL